MAREVDERMIVTAGPVVIFKWVNAPGWPVEYVSPNVREVFGYLDTQFLSGEIPYAEIVHPDDLARVGGEVAEASGAEVSGFTHRPYRVRRRDGGYIWLYDRTSILRGPDRAPTHYVGYVVDITPQIVAEEQNRQLERQLLHAQKLESLGVLAGGIAHDFNNLLTGVLGHASLALAQLGQDEAATRASVEQIRSIAVQAAELCRQLLAYSGKGRFVIEPVDLGALVAEMTGMLEVAISRKARLELELGQGPLFVDGDRTQLQQVVMNLITNASEALESGSGTIRVRLRPTDCDPGRLEDRVGTDAVTPGRFVELELTDDGVGMSAETRERLFDPFFTTKVTGRGLGMAAVLGIVRGHGGVISVRSRPGAGTTFRIHLPAARDATPRPTPAPATGEVWRGHGLILLADDEDPVRDVATKMLAHIGFEVLSAPHGQGLLELAARHGDRVRAVVLDVSMPGLDGPATLARLRAAGCAAPVLMSSGYAEEEAVAGDPLRGPVGFLQKPYQIAQLSNALRSMLDGSS
jgi:two-component system cell cycle sensor histidine kinase/response regulator CckA